MKFMSMKICGGSMSSCSAMRRRLVTFVLMPVKMIVFWSGR